MSMKIHIFYCDAMCHNCHNVAVKSTSVVQQIAPARFVADSKLCRDDKLWRVRLHKLSSARDDNLYMG